ncbi:hypothetical protein Hanom_Chr08g00741121 [Helianthus anomalus]
MTVKKKVKLVISVINLVISQAYRSTIQDFVPSSFPRSIFKKHTTKLWTPDKTANV